MRQFIYATALILSCLPARFAEPHGTPIQLGAAGGSLAVSGGLADDEGFASQVFVEDDEDGDPFASLVLPNVGPVIIWQIPGLNISGLNNQSSLSIEAIARPVKDSNPLDHRVLWYWNPQSELVEPATSNLDFFLLGTGARYETLSADDTIAPPPFLLANSLSGQQGFHNHGLLSYALDNDPPPAVGAYGFFARFTSNQYAPSDPFLVVVNHGVDFEQIVTAALAINAAAVDSLLPGDFNRDGAVDAADYAVWRKTPGIGEYQEWHNNFGRTDNEARRAATVVPEPTSYVYLIWIAVTLMERSIPHRDVRRFRR